MTKTALMFLTVGDINHSELWKKFIDEDKFTVYIHTKEEITDPYFKKFVIPEQIDTKWGEISLVKATLLLIKHALKNEDNNRFILLSDSTVPVKSSKYVYNLSQSIKQNCFWVVNALKNISHQWFMINRVFASYLVNNDYTKLYEHVNIPDEKYFLFVCRKYRFTYKNFPTTYVNWNVKTIREDKKGRSPKTYNMISKRDLLLVKRSSCMFMRKIDKNCNLDYDFLLS
jgi:hypothetical protein